MSDPSDPSREEVPAADLELSPGRRLRQARRRRGYEIGQVARELRLPLDRVAALENDNYEGLPAPVFVAGYLKTYARLVGLDPEPRRDTSAWSAAWPPSPPSFSSPCWPSPGGRNILAIGQPRRPGSRWWHCRSRMGPTFPPPRQFRPAVSLRTSPLAN